MMRTGLGRIATLGEQTPTSAVVDRIKTHLKLSHVQVAIGEGKTLGKMALNVPFKATLILVIYKTRVCLGPTNVHV